MQEIPGAIYFPEIPMVMIPNSEVGDYAARVKGIQKGDYELVTALIKSSQVLQQHQFNGHLDPGQTETHTVDVHPVLGLEIEGESVMVFWPTPAPNFVLETKNDLAAADWTLVQGVTNASVTLPLDAGNQFFRLRK